MIDYLNFSVSHVWKWCNNNNNFIYFFPKQIPHILTKKKNKNRGGVVVKTKLGSIQVGIPPETLKDSLSKNLDVPTYFVLGEELFDRTNGINVAEAEFPAYWNFFIKKKVEKEKNG